MYQALDVSVERIALPRARCNCARVKVSRVEEVECQWLQVNRKFVFLRQLFTQRAKDTALRGSPHSATHQSHAYKISKLLFLRGIQEALQVDALGPLDRQTQCPVPNQLCQWS